MNITFENNVHIYHLDLLMIFDHLSVVHIHDHHFDDVNDMMMHHDLLVMNDDVMMMYNVHDHLFKNDQKKKE